MVSYERSSKCYPLICRVPGNNWSKITVAGWKDPRNKTLEQCKTFCTENQECKSCAGSAWDDDSWWWAVKTPASEFVRVTQDAPCYYKKASRCYTINVPKECSSGKDNPDSILGCTLPSGKVWADYQIHKYVSTKEECESICNSKLECKSCARVRNQSNYWYPLSIDSTKFRNNVPPGGRRTPIDVYDKPRSKCDPPVRVYSKCSDAPRLRMADSQGQPPPWLGYFYLDILNDSFNIGEQLREINGVVFCHELVV